MLTNIKQQKDAYYKDKKKLSFLPCKQKKN